MTLDRQAIERLAPRGAFAFEIERAEIGDDGAFLVRGVMNSFRPMRSRRILHPQGYIEWLERSPGARLPMLANHGYGGGGAYAVIGTWDEFSYDPARGAVWGGTVGSGTALCDEARTLLSQGLLRGLSWGWCPLAPARWVTLKDADLDAHFRAVMEADGVDECYACWRYEPVEGSIVDVADDRLGLLAARQAAADADALAAIGARVDEIGVAVRSLAVSLTGARLATGDALDSQIAEIMRRMTDGMETRLAQMIEAHMMDPDADYARALMADDAPACDHGTHSERPESSAKVMVSRAALDTLLREIR